MATLKDLCSNVPQSLKFEQARYNCAQRAAASYAKRVEALSEEKHIFEACKTARPKKKDRNKFSREEAGTCGTITCTKRFENSYIHVVYKRHNNI